MRVAFLGTGAMGAPMARNLARAGHEVRAWNRTRARAEPLAVDGVAVAATPAEATEDAEVLVTMVTDGPAVAESVDEILRPGLLWLQTSTVGVAWSDRLAAAAAEAGAALVDAPVIGSVQPAEAGELTILASGPADAIDRLEPVLDAIGSSTLRLGEAGAGTRMKLVFNLWILSVTAVAGEAIALAETLGAGGERFLELIQGTFADAGYAQRKGPLMLRRDYAPSFKLGLGRKDAALALEAARDEGLEVRLAAALVEAMDAAIERGYADGDIAAVHESTRPGSA
jgi:3-hydroxyisobutyrate dehydrogenase